MKYRKETKPLNYDDAKEKALRYLEFRSHSEKELSDKLKRAGADDDIIQQIMTFLREYKLVNDLDYARRYSRDLQNLKKFGKNRIITELKIKGISHDIIDTVISELPQAEDNILEEMIKKRLKDNFDKKNKDKVIRYFIYRGYQFDEIKECINKLEQNQCNK
ncbi:MAG: regulatory protein RecX [Clostridia bacterium]|nr:regulatory protein RecX [Clostridia bacterium]